MVVREGEEAPFRIEVVRSWVWGHVSPSFSLSHALSSSLSLSLPLSCEHHGSARESAIPS